MGHLSVAVEVSALSHGSHEQRSFVAFALTALRADESTDAATWSSRWLRRRDRIGAERSTRSWLVARSSVLGIAPKVTWAAPHAQVVLLASGPLVFRVDLPGVITIHSVTDVMRFEDAGSPSHRVGELLRRSVGAGALIHTVCSAAADAAVSILKLDRASVAVAFPGLDVTPRTALASSESVGVVAGMNQALDLATVDAVRLRGVPAELIQAADAASSRPCVVFASPGNGFPFAAIEAMACDTPVVAARTPTTSEILEGAAVLVDAAPTTDVADAAAALATKDAPRTLVVAAGRARANDFSLGGRGPELVSLLHRALASR